VEEQQQWDQQPEAEEDQRKSIQDPHNYSKDNMAAPDQDGQNEVKFIEPNQD
jgi:hypothetical protein